LLYPIFFIFLIPQLIKNIKLFPRIFFCFIVLPLFIYFFSYSQLFLLGGNLKDFVDLHKQIFLYQTHLTATHGYQSMAWQWPLLIRPVWFYVQYLKNSVANIYNLGNPAVFWGGVLSVIYFLLVQGRSLFSDKVRPFQHALFAYFFLFLPFIFSPRIMFLHHYLPALPLLCLITARALTKINNKFLTMGYLLLVIVLFGFFYPLNTAILLPNEWLKYWFWLPTWR
jgi:dolichyl-phosphate-mannose-protein mannosyltransferase